MSISKTLCFLVFAGVIITEAPAVWPELFQENFDEKMSYPVFGSGTTKGTFYYDHQNNRYVITRENGKWDRYCGTVYPFRSTPCTHIVSGGNRYLHFPEKNYCCFCCSAAQGCGMLKPDWTDGAVFVRDYVDEKGRTIHVYDKKGMQSNLIHITDDKKQIIRIEQIPNDDQVFNEDSFSTTVDPAVFNLPDICKVENACGKLTTCGQIPKVGSKFTEEN